MYTWQNDSFRVTLEHSHWGNGREYLKYEFYDFQVSNSPVFQGNDFSSSPMVESQSEDSVMSLLGFLSCQEGDTDDEYFKDYTQEQLAWRDSFRCDDIKMLLYDYEESKNV